MALGQGEQTTDKQFAVSMSASRESSDTKRDLLPTIALPRGGGAIRGIGEKFAANPVSGTGSMTVPLATSPGRSGFGPQLSLSYDSGGGNGPFGFGWSLSLPAITRKTDKGLPQYRDADESDVYILSGAEDLVPVLLPDGTRFKDDTTAPGYTIHRYRPRIEGLFARIERWTNSATGEIHWRSITRDNVTTLYGKDNNSRIFDPADPMSAHPTHVFSWLICASYDDKGNAIVYECAAENDDNVDRAQANERNRVRIANRYLKHIKYGNRTPNRDVTTWQATDPAQLPKETWMFEVVFDYGEGHFTEDAPDAQGRVFARALIDPPAGSYWPLRQDPFSTYRAGFEVRTYRLCRRVLMFHHFAELGSEPYLVRSTEFEYADLDYSQPTTIEAELTHQGSTRFASFIRAVTQSGLVRDDTQVVLERNGIRSVTYLKKSLPPLEFAYSKARIQDDIREVDAGSLENLPIGLDGTSYQWVDLDGEGVTGILTEQANAWFYKPNLGEGSFGPLEVVAAKPSLAALGTGRQQLLDLASDGQLDLVTFTGTTPGFYERIQNEDWEPFKAFVSLPNIPWDEPNLRFIDLNGDGHADVLISEHDVFTWYPSLAEEGFSSSQYVRKPLDEETGPRLVFADGTQSIYLADMSGDGLTDLVRIRNGEVCYWPNLGYGHFGAKVTMDNSPWFDNPDQFSQQRIRLADIDGSGTNDMIYLGCDGVCLYFNQSGNRWSEPRHLSQFPRVDHLSSVMTADLQGNGTACLVWSSPLPGAARRPMRYVALMEEKPHLLVGVKNNLGAETKVHYAPSTKFYLQDKRDGKPWITRLPFPVHVVERVEAYDRISRNRFVTRYAYHHGYFDGVEREFRGFGMVEQLDTEEFAALAEGGIMPETANLDAASHLPTVLTKTWFHTGVYVGSDHVSDFFAGLLDADDKGEYYREQGLTDAQARALLLPDTVLPTGLTPEEEREASRALKGSMLRQEIYALDGTDKEKHPYTVTEQNFTIERLQSKGDNRHAVFFTHAREAITYHYERNPVDPRIQHALTLEVDGLGNVLKEAAIGYGRRQPDAALPLQADRDKQTQPFITYTENRVAKDPITYVIDTANDYRTPHPAETRTYELTSYTPTGSAGRFQASDFVKPDPNDPDGQKRVHIFDSEINYEEKPSNCRQRRLIEQVRTLYRRDDLTALLNLEELESRALPGESYKLAFTPGLLTQVFRRNGQPLLANPANVLSGQGADRGGYVDLDGNGRWWIPSGRTFFSSNPNDTATQELAHARQHFFLPHRYRDPFHTSPINTETFVSYDVYDLLLEETRDALGNRVTVGERNVDPTQPLVRHGHDYRALQPALIMDPNRNRSAVAFDALGMVVGTAVMGKLEDNPVPGDRLAATFHTDLTQAEIDQFFANPKGPMVAILLDSATTRIIYDLTGYWREPDPQKKPPAFAATLARETHTSDPVPAGDLKIQVSFSYSDGFGREIQKKIQAEPGPIVEGGPVMNPRWVGSGWTIFNNKGKPVRQYEPFFDDTHDFRFGNQVGVSPILFYDPVGRVVATLHPNHTYEKVVFDPWSQTTYDVNDTVAAHGTEETGDPRTDPDIAGYVREYFKTQPATWQTWHAQRIGNPAGDPERDAAQKADAHADTPSVAHFDALGRAFVTIAYNRYERNGAVIEEKNATHVELDIEGNQRVVIDAKDRIVMRYDYDILGNRIHQASMEAGERWILNDVRGKPIYAWDSKTFMRRMTYDALRRPTDLFVTENGVERLAERTVYGENQGDANNHRTRVYQVFDGAGVASVAYDFKGNLQEGQRELLPTYKLAVNWSQNPAANDGSFTSSTTYDALNRPLTITSPDGSVYRPTFNEANLLDKVDVNLRGAAVATHFVTNIDYNAKGQRKLIEYGCGAGPNRQGVTTTYDYDENTFRLIHLKTTRPAGLNSPASQIFADPTVVQDLRYTYDPVGNITRIEDAALKTIVYNGQSVEPVGSYTYDALYRLIKAQGREHIGQMAFDFNPPNGNYRDYPFIGNRANPNDLQALRNYTQHYEYDAVGNFEILRHLANGGGWTRRYIYDEDSLIEAGKKSNRLTRTIVGNGINQIEPYTHDAHGNMTTMPHLTAMVWDFEDRLQQVDTGGSTGYYIYDAGGQRVRKVIDSQNGTRQKERIYLGGVEIYREFNGNGATVTLARESLHVMDDKQRIALVETQTIKNSNPVNDPVPLQRYQFGNHLGSASIELAEDGALISYEEYHPYGTTAFQAGRSVAEVNLKRYRYTGKERDEESGFYYHGVRYFASWLGRWISCDPAGLTDGVNTYSYARDNPALYKDTDGRFPTASALADSWQELGWSVGIAGALPVTGEDVVRSVGGVTDKLSGYYLDAALPQGSGLDAYMRRLVGNVSLTVLKTVVDVGTGVVAGAVDPGFVVRGVMRMGETSASGVEDIQNGNVVLGTSKIVGEVAAAVGLVGGGVLGARALGVPGTYQAPLPSPAAPAPEPAPAAPAPPAPAAPAPEPAPAAPAPEPAPASVAHGNSLDNSKLHHVYEIHDATTPGAPYKTGISGKPLYKNGSSPRANVQLSELNNANPVPPGQPPRFSAKIIGENLPNRRAALAFEQYQVNVQKNTLGTPGIGNDLPKPNQMFGPGARGH